MHMLDNGMAQLPPAVATSIGSLPHLDAVEAVAFALRLQPDMPTAPQLSAPGGDEGMLVQAETGGEIVGPAWAGLHAFLDAVADRRGWAKFQLTGPITSGLALRESGIPVGDAFVRAAEAVKAQAHAIVKLVRTRAPHVRPVVFLDEPGLTACSAPRFPLDADSVVDILSASLAALGHEVVTGVHCCGSADLQLITAAGPAILSVPATPDVVRFASTITGFLEHGGWVAWGSVPTDGPLGENADVHWRHLVDVWCALTQAGCPPALLRQQALITPACGLAGHTVGQAERVLALVDAVASRVHGQAVASRLSVGA